jgi:hypothetical protein
MPEGRKGQGTPKLTWLHSTVAYRHVAGQEPRSEQRDNGCCLITAGKHINNIRAIARKPPITTTEELLETVFSVRLVPSGYKGDAVS